MLFIGSSIGTATGDDRRYLLHLHTTIGVSAYALLWLRVVWRFTCGHPGPRSRQKGFFFLVGKCVHLSLAAAIGVMLLTGPLIVWSSGGAIEVFALTIPSPIEIAPELHQIVRPAHAIAAMVILAGTLLHILGAIKHSVINRDGTFEKMMIAARRDDDRLAGRAPERRPAAEDRFRSVSTSPSQPNKSGA